MTLRIACIVPTYNGRADLERLLDSLRMQTATFDLFIVDSSSRDGTLELARERTPNVTVIPSREFNHGGTRQRMVDNHPGYDVYVFATQDACLVDEHAIERLVAPFADPRLGAVCGRQLPHLDATPSAQFARHFNYPAAGRVKTRDDIPELGLKTVFMSNSFAAYRGEALHEVGGFPDHVIFAEDMYAVAKMVLAGWKVAYSGDAQCRHSHNYTLNEEFRRYFDMGVFHAREPWIRRAFGGAGGEGFRFVRSELAFLGIGRLHLWPGSILRSTLRLLGYKLGQQDARLPLGLKRRVGMYRGYWNSPAGLAGPSRNRS